MSKFNSRVYNTSTHFTNELYNLKTNVNNNSKKAIKLKTYMKHINKIDCQVFDKINYLAFDSIMF